MTNYIKHAKTLTLDQWRGEICSGAEGEGPLWNDIVREMDSFPQRDPMRSLVEPLFVYMFLLTCSVFNTESEKL